jgi:predicted nuclease of predicted toxin-antitoxin system
LSPVTAEYLRSLRHDAIRASDRLPATATDQEIVALARAEGRVIVTQDQDFGALLAASRQATPSVVNLRIEAPRVERVNAVLREVLATAENALNRGAIITVEDDRFRIRRLPIGSEPPADESSE